MPRLSGFPSNEIFTSLYPLPTTQCEVNLWVVGMARGLVPYDREMLRVVHVGVNFRSVLI